MSESLVELAQQELEDHGMDVDDPDRVRVRGEMEQTDMIGGFEPGVRSASYKAITDTINLHEPVAKEAAVKEVLSENELDILVSMLSSSEGPEVLQRNASKAFENMNMVKGGIEMTGLDVETSQVAREVATGTAIYDAMVEGMELEQIENLEKELIQEYQDQLRVSAEHELVHKYAVDAFVTSEERTREIVSNIGELAALETRELYGETSINEKQVVSQTVHMENQFPRRNRDVYRAALMEIEPEKYEQKKEELRDEEEPHKELEEYLDERAEEIEEEIQNYLKPFYEHAEAIADVHVGSVGESFAHFWNMYRDGALDDQEKRKRKKEGLRENYPEGGERAAQMIDELFRKFDELGGTDKHRVTEIMKQQEQYLEEEMDRTFVDRVTDRIPDSDYLPF